MYDSVIVECYRCGYEIELQSNSGECEYRTYGIHDAPLDVLASLKDEVFECECGKKYMLKVHVNAQIVTLSS